MNNIFVVLLPSVFGIKLISSLTRKKDYKDLIVYYFILLLFSNLFSLIIVALVNKFDGNLIIYIQEHLKFAIKYIVLALTINIILAFVFSFFIKYFSLKLEVKYEKGNKKHN